MPETPDTSTMVRQTVLFSGRVQGVGFRYTTSRVARRYTVAGYVQNLSDGRVKVVAEGEPSDVQGFIDAVNDTMSRYIHDRQIDQSAANGEFGRPGAPDTFGVRY